MYSLKYLRRYLYSKILSNESTCIYPRCIHCFAEGLVVGHIRSEHQRAELREREAAHRYEYMASVQNTRALPGYYVVTAGLVRHTK